MTDNNVFIEQQLIDAVKKLLAGRVNEILENQQFLFPVIEFGAFTSNSVVVPTITLTGSEQTEKERIIKLDVYLLTVVFSLSELPESELYCYGYSAAFGKALGEDVTLGGIVDRAVITGKKYTPPKKANCGQGWELTLSLRVTIEGIAK